MFFNTDKFTEYTTWSNGNSKSITFFTAEGGR